MKLNREHRIIAASSLALLVVLSIQINWIFESARAKEALFNDKASLVLSKTADALRSDSATIQTLQLCAGQNEMRKIESLFNYYMKLYNVKITYYFAVVPGFGQSNGTGPFQPGCNTGTEGCYTACVKDVPLNTSGKGVELKLLFPDKDEFLMAEMSIPFISSILLIVIVMVLFWKTVQLLTKEKEISQHTRDFLNNMTHEFKTPLTNIALAGKMIQKEQNIVQEDKIKHYSGIILEENEKLRQQVEQVLNMTALERGEVPLRKAELDFHDLIRDGLKCMSVQLENRQGVLELKLEAQRSVILGDKTHLTNALCNLLDNAIKYSREKPEICIHTYNSSDQLLIVIADKGIGIEQEYQEKVFEKFFRVPTGDIHDVKGFGMGLAYTKKIIELHGALTLESEEGHGSTFTISISYV